MSISSWLNFGHTTPPGSGSAAGWKFLAWPYYSQLTVFTSLWALLSCLGLGQTHNIINRQDDKLHRYMLFELSHQDCVRLCRWYTTNKSTPTTGDKKNDPCVIEKSANFCLQTKVGQKYLWTCLKTRHFGRNCVLWLVSAFCLQTCRPSVTTQRRSSWLKYIQS